MKKTFICSLCHNGVLGGALYVDETSITYKTNKLTVDAKYRNLVLPLSNIEEITWEQKGLPIATFHMKTNEKYKFIIFNKKGFLSHYQKLISK